MVSTDVLIIGAGVAGLFTAINLDRKFHVIILEKQSFPPRKLCAGLLCNAAYTLIKDLHPPEYLYYQPAVLRAKIVDQDNTLHFYARESFRNLNREKLYAWFKSMLTDNVSIRPQARVVMFSREKDHFLATVVDDKQQQIRLRAKYLVGADGFHSRVRRHFFAARPDFIHSAQYTVKENGSLGETEFIFNQTLCRSYYTWLVPRDNELIIGTGIEGLNYRRLPQYLAKEYGINCESPVKRGYPITKLSSLDQIILGREKLLLVGEAAGMVRPSSGEGLTMALQSAVYAAAALRESPHDPCAVYSKACEKIYAIIRRDIQAAAIIFNPSRRKSVFSKLQ